MSSEFLIIGPAFIAVFLILGWITVNFYRKCPPNMAMIISGMMTGEQGRAFKIVVGGGATLLPVIQQANFLSLEVTEIQLKSNDPLNSSNGIPFVVSSAAQVKVKSDFDSIATAAEHLLSKTGDQVSAIVEQILTGSLRQTIASLSAELVVRHPEIVVSKVKELSEIELQKMGLTLVSFSIMSIKDEVGYLDLLAREEVEHKRQEIEA